MTPRERLERMAQHRANLAKLHEQNPMAEIFYREKVRTEMASLEKEIENDSLQLRAQVAPLAGLADQVQAEHATAPTAWVEPVMSPERLAQRAELSPFHAAADALKAKQRRARGGR